MEAMGRTSNQWLLAGLLTVARTCRKLAQVLVAGLWEVVMRLMQIYMVLRSFVSGSSRVCECPGA